MKILQQYECGLVMFSGHKSVFLQGDRLTRLSPSGDPTQ